MLVASQNNPDFHQALLGMPTGTNTGEVARWNTETDLRVGLKFTPVQKEWRPEKPQPAEDEGKLVFPVTRGLGI